MEVLKITRKIPFKHNKELVPRAKKLRRELTKEERHLWYDFLRTYPVRFCRQKVLGNYIADFYSAPAKLIIELDGSQHYQDDHLSKDEKRTSFLQQYGLEVIRFSNKEIHDHFQGVCEWIDQSVKKRMRETL